MDVRRDFLPKVVEEKHPNDKTFSHSGKPDFTKENPEIATLEIKPATPRARTRASINNSYT